MPLGQPRPLALHSLLLVAALAGAVAGQGAYYSASRWPVIVLLTGALVVALRAHPWSTSDTRFAPLALCVLLAAWATVRAAAAGDVADGVGVVALLVGVAATVLVARRTPDVEVLGGAAVALGVVAALTGWIGVAWRISPWALEDQELWRAATTITYANAAGGMLAALALVALGRLVARPDSRLAALSVCVLLTGLGATLSRGSLLAGAVGGAALMALVGVHAVVRAALAPLLGASVALAALVPSMSALSSPHPVIAIVGLVAGLGLTGGLLAGGHRLRMVTAAVSLPVAVGLVLALGDGGDGVTALRHGRFSAASADRADQLRGAFQLVAEHPVVGVGPARATPSWVGEDGTTFVAKYAHNEYLELLAEMGAVGLVLLLALFVAVGRAVRDARPAHPSIPLWGGATAGLVALAVGSALDFLWHVPVVPLVGGLLVGITVPKGKEKVQP